MQCSGEWVIICNNAASQDMELMFDFGFSFDRSFQAEATTILLRQALPRLVLPRPPVQALAMAVSSVV